MMLRLFLLVFAMLLLNGCGFLSSINPFGSDSAEQAVEEEAPQQQPEQSARVIPEVVPTPAPTVVPTPAAAQKRPVAKGGSAVDLVWRVPGEAVEKYYIRYGLSEVVLDQQLEVRVGELQKIDDPVHGPLYRYVIKGVPNRQPVYFTIQAENQYGLSPTSPVQKAEPKKVGPAKR